MQDLCWSKLHFKSICQHVKSLPDPGLPVPPFLSVTGDGGSPEGTGLKPAAALPPSVHDSIFTPAEREEASTSAPVPVWPLLSDRWSGSWSTGQGAGPLVRLGQTTFIQSNLLLLLLLFQTRNWFADLQTMTWALAANVANLNANWECWRYYNARATC